MAPVAGGIAHAQQHWLILGPRARERFRGPSAANFFGTDNFGRDVFTRVLYGSRVSLEIGFYTVVVTAMFGTAAGAAAG